ncbi:thiamine ABC transporter ATP-binding protein [Rhizobium paknamense]|uniref:Thiamine transport system ATP-binding protein n=1 Tax=Rhizobium paknamense TaxID=1206817 RepID=A0ABU0II87_9HYPH|nr:ATP-binding cassette domain-containing protein [Rhizobium paknamense]MDQ0457387.1 thiamine transport system ATP-binding protein [Rhizobium paknamense]
MTEREKDALALEGVELQLGARDFHFDARFAPNAITAITGPSGAGKSTLINLIAGFERPARGRILFSGADLTAQLPGLRPVSLIFQDNNLFAHLDLATNIGLGIHPGLKLDAEDRASISRALSDVGLAGYERRKPATLSGGERQRAAFARALVRRKPILLLDEPFAALDPGLRAEMGELLLSLQRQTASTVLLVTHNPQDVAALADEVAFLQQGRLDFLVPQNQFFAMRDVPEVQRFLGKS